MSEYYYIVREGLILVHDRKIMSECWIDSKAQDIKPNEFFVYTHGSIYKRIDKFE